jgi:hypothetical protein
LASLVIEFQPSRLFMASEIRIETAPPKLFTKKLIAAQGLYDLLGLIPVCFVFLIMVAHLLLFPRGVVSDSIWLIIIMTLLVLALVLPIYFLPILMANPLVRKLVRSLDSSKQNGLVVQLTNLPRSKWGFWAFMEDADDIGFLNLEGECLVFNGDSTTFSIPFGLIQDVRRKNFGWRGIWIYGSRIVIDISDRSFAIAERFSLSVPASRKISKGLFNQLSSKVRK